MKKDIKAFSHTELADLMASLSQPAFRTKQLFQWLYAHNASSYDEMTNLPASLRDELAKYYPLTTGKIVNHQVSKDKTRKYVVEFEDGARVETVAIPSSKKPSRSEAGAGESKGSGSLQIPDSVFNQDFELNEADESPVNDRLSVCFSTQVGCSMKCSFCATGKEGFTRNLTPGEIIDQIMLVQADFAQTRVSSLVGMGQGEPFLNYDNTLAALRIANSPDSLNIGARHITVSTCGIIHGINRFAGEPEQFTLAVSLHAALQPVRDTLMPAMASFPLPDLKKALMGYCEATNRRVTLEYLMIDGVNDTREALSALQGFCKGLLCHVNLLPMNAVKGNSYHPSHPSTMKTWAATLSRSGVETTIRNSRGSDIAGACGQLKNSL